MANQIISRICITCKTVKELSEFHKDKNKIGGVSNRCKPCVLQAVSNYRKTKKPQINEIIKQWKQGCLERFPINRDIIERIFSNIKISTEHFYKGVPCWEWQSFIHKKHGYALFNLFARTFQAHRLIYQIFVEVIPTTKLKCDHLCRVRHCVNPAHIEVVTNKVNILRGKSQIAKNAIKTHCIKGHAFSGDNLGKTKHGRQCKQCSRDNAKRHYYAKKQIA